MVAGAVRVRTTTAPHMVANADAPRARRAASAEKVSPKIHTLRAMLTMGSTMTKEGLRGTQGANMESRLVEDLSAGVPLAASV